MELELRAKITSLEEIIKKLEELGAKKLGETELTDYYFGELALYQKLGYSFWIRIRVEGDKIGLAYKGSTGRDGVYDELEQELQDLDTSIAILTKMGLENEITVHKKRTSYKIGDISIEIDDLGEKGKFIEAERVSEDGDKSRLFELFKSVGIPESDTFERGLITLLLEEKGSPFADWIKN